jgi:hypothetical protein
VLEYLCVVGKDGKPICVGQDRDGNGFWSKGKPSQDTKEKGDCTEKEPDDLCSAKTSSEAATERKGLSYSLVTFPRS